MEKENSVMESEMNRGFLQLVTLLTLEQPMYGYQMIKNLQKIGCQIEENSLYPLLRRLEKNHFISSNWKVEESRPKKYYQITQTGKILRNRFLKIWETQKQIIDILQKEVV
jgi:DNA-binding PadR family transcriptional regulator